MKRLGVIVSAIVLAGCQTNLEELGASFTTSAAEGLYEQIAPLVSDRSIASWLADEAAAAGVGVIWTYPSGQRPSYGIASANNVILVEDSPTGRSPANIAHEIAHIAAYHRGCYAHGFIWLNYYMAMAERFEASFPGVRWNRVRPTQSVAADRMRYGHELTQC